MNTMRSFLTEIGLPNIEDHKMLYDTNRINYLPAERLMMFEKNVRPMEGITNVHQLRSPSSSCGVQTRSNPRQHDTLYKAGIMCFPPHFHLAYCRYHWSRLHEIQSLAVTSQVKGYLHNEKYTLYKNDTQNFCEKRFHRRRVSTTHCNLESFPSAPKSILLTHSRYHWSRPHKMRSFDLLLPGC